ncbi:MAG: hypothetical protein K9N40_07380 [Candidatus Cloacimonetes bacterium]|nr:hypothetical protein [Candidatus Cloacimonadota bacterium]
MKMTKKLVTVILLLIAVSYLISLPIVPGKETGHSPTKEYPSEIFGRQNGNREVDLPQSILALRVEFTDVQFDLVPDFPDSLAHDKEFYERLLFHNASYWQDASHGEYVLTEDNYTVWSEVISLPNSMAYYGDDDLQIERVCEMVVDLIDAVDDDIDFNEFDAFIIIHAGAGQETDPDMEEEIYSTFLSRRSLQAGIDPENDDFPGIETNDGIFLKEFAIIPETSNQPYIQPGDALYGLLGVIVHNFGHQIGLPTLFDNNSSNGVSYGIGGFGLMGTGVWNANGYVPPLPCAWSRHYLGWEDNIVEIDETTDELELTFPMADDDVTPKLYKLKITDDEYFLIENRQQNPDNSMYVNADGDTVVSFTFATIPDQPVYPPGNVNEGQPKFSFMENSYLGCEWDFYLPGYSYSSDPDADGSGILIWHIDENVIDANFDPEFEMNEVNGDASHKGVDLEQASGIQTLDSPQYGLESFYGSMYDAYRKRYINDNADSLAYYFGFSNHDGISWSPTAESYYGGIPLEVDDISESDSLMTLSVRYGWSLDAGNDGENKLSAFAIDFDLDGETELFAPQPNGEVYLWQDEMQFPDFPIDTGSSIQVPFPCTYDELSNSVLMQGEVDVTNAAALYLINYDIPGYIDDIYFDTDRKWAGPVVINPDTNFEQRLFLPLKVPSEDDSSLLVAMDDDFNTMGSDIILRDIISNMVLENNKIHLMVGDWEMFVKDLPENSVSISGLEMTEPYPEIWSFQMADINSDETAEYVITAADSMLYVFAQDGSKFPNFPVEIGLNAVSIPSFADVDMNGQLDILIGGENTFKVFSASGSFMMPSQTLANPDSTISAAGIIAADVTGNGQLEILGNFSRNRFSIWENINNNNFELSRNYPLTFSKRSLNYPVLSEYSNQPFRAYLSSNDGVIFRSELPINQMPNLHGSLHEYCNLQRTGYWQQDTSIPFETDDLFLKDETYFYPNPLSSVFSKGVDFGNEVPYMTIILRIMTSEDVDVNVKIFDSAANKIYQQDQYCEKYIPKKVYINAKKWASGVYFAIIKANGKVIKRKFAIEK